MVDGEVVTIEDQADQFSISLPVTRDQFGDFLSGIIGGKEKITAYISDPLYIDLDNAVSLAKAIIQRVTRNNETSVVTSEFSIRFSNDRTYTEHSIKAFSELAPVGESDTQMVEISFDFLGKFPKYDFPIRQSVRVLLSNTLETGKEGENTVYPSALIDVHFVERTWGEDLASLCQKFLMEFSESAKDESRAKLWVEEKKGWIVGLSAVFSIAIYLILPFLVDIHVTEEIKSIAYYQVADLKDLALFILETVDPRSNISFGLFVLFVTSSVFFVTALVTVLSYTESSAKKVSFGFTKADQIEYQKLSEKRRRASLLTVPAAIVAIGLSVFFGYVFEFSKVFFGL